MRSEKQIKVCFVPTLNVPIIFWRIESYAKWLFDRRHETNIYPMVEYLIDPNTKQSWEFLVDKNNDDAKMIRQKLDSMFKYFDVIIFQRMNYVEGLIHVLELKSKYPNVKVLMDIDDAIGDWTPSNFHIDQITNQDSLSAKQAEYSDLLICSTQYLKNSLLWLNKRAVVVKNAVNMDIINLDRSGKRLNVKNHIGYVAGGGHDEDLLIAYRGWQLIEDKPRFVIRYGGFRPEWLLDDPLIDFKIVDWHMSSYFQKLFDLNLDLLLAPLRDTHFNRCKSNIKELEAKIIGTRFLASDVEPYKGHEYIIDNDVKSWKNGIEQILIDGKREELTEDFSIYGNEFIKILISLF